MGRKPGWAIEKERARRGAGAGGVWLFGLHAVRDALTNPARERRSLLLTRNAADRLAEAVAALEVLPLDWGSVSEVCAPRGGAPRVLLLDRVSDPHNVGAVLRSAEVFGARAVIAPQRHSAPETGALAKSASGALERQPYLRVPNLARAIETLRDMDYAVLGLDGAAETELDDGLRGLEARPLALALGAEGPGMRELTTKLCDRLVRIPARGAFGSLNVSNAAAVALYAAR